MFNRFRRFPVQSEQKYVLYMGFQVRIRVSARKNAKKKPAFWLRWSVEGVYGHPPRFSAVFRHFLPLHTLKRTLKIGSGRKTMLI